MAGGGGSATTDGQAWEGRRPPAGTKDAAPTAARTAVAAARLAAAGARAPADSGSAPAKTVTARRGARAHGAASAAAAPSAAAAAAAATPPGDAPPHTILPRASPSTTTPH